MTITDESRYHLHQRLEAVLGPQEATVLVEHLPPVGWADVATKRDLGHLASQLRLEAAAAESRLQAAPTKFEAGIRTGMAASEQGVRADMAAMEQGIRASMATMVSVSTRKNSSSTPTVKSSPRGSSNTSNAWRASTGALYPTGYRTRLRPGQDEPDEPWPPASNVIQHRTGADQDGIVVP